eukprot:scaffold84277_cov57-Phaeocystis_antarctica.AAC.4
MHGPRGLVRVRVRARVSGQREGLGLGLGLTLTLAGAACYFLLTSYFLPATRRSHLATPRHVPPPVRAATPCAPWPAPAAAHVPA